MKTLIKLAKQRSCYPILQNVKIANGIAQATDLNVTIEYPCVHADGIYSAEVLSVGLWKEDRSESEWPEIMQYTCTDSVSVHYDNLEWVSLAMSDETCKYYLQGVAFDSESIVATDGHRLHRIVTTTSLSDKALIIPADSVKLILQAAKEEKIKEFGITFCKNGFSVIIGKYKIYGKLIEGTFPDYKRVIPNWHNMQKIGKWNHKEIKALKPEVFALCKANRMREKIVKFEENEMTIIAGEFSETIPSPVPGLIGGFNFDYLLDVTIDCAVYSDGPLKAFLFKGDGIEAVLIPCRY